MNVETSRAPVALALLKWAGTLAGAAFGLGLLAFLVGFQAQRAQYEVARAPMVFVDYWSCAEIGAVAVLDSLYIAVQSPAVIFGLIAASVAIFLLLEEDRFRSAMLRPIPNFVCLLVLLASLLLTLRQQLTPLATTRVTASALDGAGSQDSVPARWPFAEFIPERAELPDGEDFHTPATSIEAWTDLARHVEDTHVDQARYLLLRPRPLWARVPAGTPEDAAEDFLGIAVPDENLDESRAQALYAIILKACAFNAWALLFAWLWNRRILRELQAGDEQRPEGRWRRLVYRLREEFWFSSSVILLPLALVLMLCSAAILPSNYGMLAFPRLGQEYAEVFVRGQSGASRPDRAEAESAAPDAELAPDLVDVAFELATDFGWASGVHKRDRVRSQWDQLVAGLERSATPAAAETLQSIAQMTTPLAPMLAEEAQKGWLRAAASTTSRRSGYILHYPRSEQVLRILEVDQTSLSGWSVLPIPMDRVLEIHVQGRQKDRALATLLRQMDGSDDGERVKLLHEILHLGHTLTLEVFLAALRDESPQIRGNAVTFVGLLASNLGDDPVSDVRRRRARHLLIEVLRDEKARLNVRSAAVTSLGHMAESHDPVICGVLLQLLTEHGLNGTDKFWELRGTAITGVGNLRCEGGAEVLATMLGDPAVPVETRGAIPAALLELGDDERTSAALSSLVRDPQTPSAALWPAISALGSVRGDATRLGVVTLCEFLETLAKRDLPPQVREMHQRLALSALLHLGDREARVTLEKVAQDREQKEDLRSLALHVLEDLESPESGGLLLSLAEDEKEPEKVRAAAIGALSGQADDAALLRLHTLYRTLHGETPRSPLLGVIRGTFEERVTEGAGLAAYLLNEIQSTPTERAERPSAQAIELPGAQTVESPGAQAAELPLPELPAPFRDARVRHTSDDSFVSDLSGADEPVLLMAWAPWCPACKATIPTFEALAAEFDGKIQFMAVNVDDNPALAARLPFSGIPSFMLLDRGRILDLSEGRMSEDELRRFLEAAATERPAL